MAPAYPMDHLSKRRTFLGQLGFAVSAVAASNGSFAQHGSLAQGVIDAPFTHGPFSDVPDEFKGVFANVRSPLIFNDGRSVRSPEDWQRRREEILANWQRIMGHGHLSCSAHRWKWLKQAIVGK